jgi:hypothetical protein
MVARLPPILVACALLPVACGGGDPCRTLEAGNADQCLRLNQVQVLGTHNSYHRQPTSALRTALDSIAPGWDPEWWYTHRPLVEQLDELNIRQLELDVFADPAGGHYVRPGGRRLEGAPPALDDERMTEPGYKVLHVPDLDYRSSCPTFVACLEEVRRWSASNPRHLPVMILVEVKDGVIRDSLDYEFTRPVPVGPPELDALDAEILGVFDRERLITPDDVRGEYASLDEAIRRRGWPTIAQSRGKVLFALDNTDAHRDAYLRDHPDLQGRVMFTSASPGERTAAFVKMNDAIDDHELIRSYVEQGYLVRTRSDIPLHEARTGDPTRREAALTSGAQFISTDYPEPSPFGSGYIVTLPQAAGRPARCNPIAAPAGCRAEWIVE